jgi:hypothetical protein
MAPFRMRLAIVIAIALASCLALSSFVTVDAVALAQPGEEIDKVGVLFPSSKVHHQGSSGRFNGKGKEARWTSATLLYAASVSLYAWYRWCICPNYRR